MIGVVYSKNSSSIFAKSKITKAILKNLLRTCSQSILVFNEDVHQQIDWLSMGSPLALLLANWFVSELEIKQNIMKLAININLQL